MDRLIALNKLSHSELLSVRELSPVNDLSAENEDDEAFVLQVKEHLRAVTGFVCLEADPHRFSSEKLNLAVSTCRQGGKAHHPNRHPDTQKDTSQR